MIFMNNRAGCLTGKKLFRKFTLLGGLAAVVFTAMIGSGCDRTKQVKADIAENRANFGHDSEKGGTTLCSYIGKDEHYNVPFGVKAI